MLNLVLSLFFLFFYRCKKNEDCITILEKKSVNDKYYFLFEPEQNLKDNSGPNQSPNIPDQYSSGEVDDLTYLKYNIGDIYCDN